MSLRRFLVYKRDLNKHMINRGSFRRPISNFFSSHTAVGLIEWTFAIPTSQRDTGGLLNNVSICKVWVSVDYIVQAEALSE